MSILRFLKDTETARKNGKVFKRGHQYIITNEKFVKQCLKKKEAVLEDVQQQDFSELIQEVQKEQLKERIEQRLLKKEQKKDKK